MKETPLNGRMLAGGYPDGQEYNTQLLYFTCSSLGESGDRVYMISDQGGSPNVIVKELFTGKEKVLTQNQAGTLKSYVYFDGEKNRGLGKASVCLDYVREIIYFIQDDKICRADREGRITEPDTGGANDSIYSCQCRWKATLCPYDRRQMPGF